MKQLVILLFLVSIISCETASNEYKTQAGGGADEIIVVVDSAVWARSVGGELRRILAAPMQGMPQDEPLFDVRRVNPIGLNSVLKSAYNMIFVTTLDSRSAQSRNLQKMFTDESLKRIQNDTAFFQVVEDDKFAMNQKVLFLFGRDEKQLAKKLSQNRAEVLHLFEMRAREITKERIFQGRSVGLEKNLLDKHGFKIQIPYGWDLAKDYPDFVWLRELDLDKEKNVFVYKQPYRGPSDFNNIETLRDKIGELHLRDGQKQHLYMMRQEVVPVSTKRVNFNGKFAIEARGMWAISDKTAGGPFLSYAVVDEPNAMLYYIEGYVYNPGGKKKRLMREMDAILSTFVVPSEAKPNQ